MVKRLKIQHVYGLVTSGHASAQCGLPAALLKAEGHACRCRTHRIRHAKTLTHTQKFPRRLLWFILAVHRSNRITGAWLNAFVLTPAFTLLFRYCTCCDTGRALAKEELCWLLYELHGGYHDDPFLFLFSGMDWSVRMRWWRISCVPTRCCSVRWVLDLFTTSRRWPTWSQHSVNTALDL